MFTLGQVLKATIKTEFKEFSDIKKFFEGYLDNPDIIITEILATPLTFPSMVISQDELDLLRIAHKQDHSYFLCLSLDSATKGSSETSRLLALKLIKKIGKALFQARAKRGLPSLSDKSTITLGCAMEGITNVQKENLREMWIESLAKTNNLK